MENFFRLYYSKTNCKSSNKIPNEKLIHELFSLMIWLIEKIAKKKLEFATNYKSFIEKSMIQRAKVENFIV